MFTWLALSWALTMGYSPDQLIVPSDNNDAYYCNVNANLDIAKQIDIFGSIETFISPYNTSLYTNIIQPSFTLGANINFNKNCLIGSKITYSYAYYSDRKYYEDNPGISNYSVLFYLQLKGEF
jgi:hypothetical protein